MHALGDKVSSNRVEDSVYARTTSIVKHDLEDVLRGVVYRHVDPKFLQGFLIMTPCTSQDSGSGSLGYLYGKGADAPGVTVYKHRLPHPDGEPTHDCLVGSATGERDGGSFLVAE